MWNLFDCKEKIKMLTSVNLWGISKNFCEQFVVMCRERERKKGKKRQEKDKEEREDYNSIDKM